MRTWGLPLILVFMATGLSAAEPRVRERAEALAAESGKGYAYAEAFKALRFVDDEEQEHAASRA